MKNLVLVGFMGTGKTAVGKRVAPRLGLRFVDMDAVIEERAGQTVAQIFAAKGEPHFRQLERDLVVELAGQQGLVIATGGGIVLNADNITDYSRTGVVVCLWAEPATIFKRTQYSRKRPLLENEADRRKRIDELLRVREPYYKAIPLLIDNSHSTVEQDVEHVLKLYQQHA